MLEEGWSIGDIPTVEVQADSEKEAKKLLLLISSRYGHITEEGFYEFLSLSELDWEELKGEIDFPEIDWNKFEANYYKSDSQDSEPQTDKISRQCLWQRNHPDKSKAQALCKDNPEKVIVLYECSCGFDDKKHNHHFDYSRAFEVIRLCERCHVIEHNRLREFE